MSLLTLHVTLKHLIYKFKQDSCPIAQTHYLNIALDLTRVKKLRHTIMMGTISRFAYQPITKIQRVINGLIKGLTIITSSKRLKMATCHARLHSRLSPISLTLLWFRKQQETTGRPSLIQLITLMAWAIAQMVMLFFKFNIRLIVHQLLQTK